MSIKSILLAIKRFVTSIHSESEEHALVLLDTPHNHHLEVLVKSALIKLTVSSSIALETEDSLRAKNVDSSYYSSVLRTSYLERL